MKLARFYLNYPGTCEEAFKDYETVFGMVSLDHPVWP